jgi:hypothetical protein
MSFSEDAYFEGAAMALVSGVPESCFWALKNVSTRNFGELAPGVCRVILPGVTLRVKEKPRTSISQSEQLAG